MHNNYGRRQFVQLLALAAMGASVGGCPWSPKPPPATSASVLRTSDTSSRLTIDVHCHIFNGSDLPMAPFATKVLAHEGDFPAWADALADLIQSVNWAIAPGADAEIAVLDSMLAASGESGRALLLDRRSEAHRRGVAELQSKAETSRSARDLDLSGASRDARALRAVRELSGQFDIDVRSRMLDRSVRLETLPAAPDYHAAAAFLAQLFQYRTTNLLTYLETFSGADVSPIDLVVPSLVDYNEWLCGSETGCTRTSLDEQIAVLEKIAIVTQGRVHGMVAFDPLRDIVSGQNAFARVKTALLERGCIGIKLYPPMGFAAYGNADIAPDLRPWSRDKTPGFPDVAYTDTFAKQLDNAMAEIFSFCRSAGIPVLAHTNRSNGQSSALEALAGAEYWSKAVAKFPGLQVDFAHFGDSSPAKNSADRRAEGFIETMQADGPQGLLFADTGYFMEVLNADGALRSRLLALAGQSGNIVATRMMYGTDWLMNCGTAGIGDYRNAFELLAADIQSTLGPSDATYSRFAANFFGANAARFLGLGKNRPTRKRLEAFYTTHQIPMPAWAQKTDRREAPAPV